MEIRNYFYSLKFRALRCFGQNLTFGMNFIEKREIKMSVFL